MVNIFLKIFIILIFVSVAGCTGLSFEPLIDETVNVPYDYIQPYELWGEYGAVFDIDIKTDGSPVDILVLDESNFVSYDQAFEYGTPGAWKGKIYRDIVSKKFSYSVPREGTYYLVIENSQFTENGADAKKGVNVAVKIE